MSKVLVIGGMFVLGGCSILPDYGKIEIEHLSHIQVGKIGTCTFAEDCITQVNGLLGYDRGLWYAECGLGWMPKDQGFKGGELTATARTGMKFKFHE